MLKWKPHWNCQLVAESRAVEEAKQQLGEEQLAVVELVNQVSAFLIVGLFVCLFFWQWVGCFVPLCWHISSINSIEYWLTWPDPWGQTGGRRGGLGDGEGSCNYQAKFSFWLPLGSFALVQSFHSSTSKFDHYPCSFGQGSLCQDPGGGAEIQPEDQQRLQDYRGSTDQDERTASAVILSKGLAELVINMSFK